jgi:predicted nucleic acid-binding protein
LAFYIDTSALVKLVVREPETDSLRDWLAETPRDPVTCDLARTELLRAVRRVAPDLLVQARMVLDLVTITDVTTAVFEAAGRLDPAILRTFDAIHVAAALDLGDDLEGMVTYDQRLAQAAEQNGIRVSSPT